MPIRALRHHGSHMLLLTMAKALLNGTDSQVSRTYPSASGEQDDYDSV
jgi:hypothetical protein